MTKKFLKIYFPGKICGWNIIYYNKPKFNILGKNLRLWVKDALKKINYKSLL